MMKIRNYPESNYRAIFFNGKTIRQKHDIFKPFLITPTTEIEDVAINSKCLANCDYCYTSATKFGKNFDNIVDKAIDVYGSLNENERPFQIAIGGAGESTMHPDWVEFVKNVKKLGIVPNYTTNGMHLNDNILKATEDYCGGVAVSYHPHISKIFHTSIDKLKSINTRLNAHIIIGDEKSFEDLKHLYDKYENIIEYFVILPYQASGRGKFIDTNDIWKKTFDFVKNKQSHKFAFGALFYNWLINNKIDLDMSIYEPELFSGYRMMDDSYKILRKSSYDLTPKYNEKEITLCI